MEFWFEGRADEIGAHLKDGLTARQIAAHFDVTSNAVIGYVRRNKELAAIGFKRSPGPVNTEKARRRKKPRAAPRPSYRVINAPPPIAPAPEPVMEFHGPHTVGVTLMMLTEKRCKWPINDGGPFLFCGEATSNTYCAHHATRSVGGGTQTERSAHRWLQAAE